MDSAIDSTASLGDCVIASRSINVGHIKIGRPRGECVITSLSVQMFLAGEVAEIMELVEPGRCIKGNIT